MNEPGNDLPVSRPVENQDAIEGLRRELNLVFAGFVVMSFTLTLFLGLEFRRAAIDLDQQRPAAQEMARMVQQDDAAVEATYAKLTEYARTHPDFQKQILSRFNLNTNTPPVAPVKK